MKALLIIGATLCLAFVLFFFTNAGSRFSQKLYLNSYDGEIKRATKSIENSRGNAERAAAYAQRGRDYGEKARYCRAFKLISIDEYIRLFNLAMADHDKAIELASENSDVYFKRGETHYWRGVVEDPKDAREWFDRAAADFDKAATLDAKKHMTFDMLGLTYMATDQLDLAIDAFTKEAALVPFGKTRLADAYCSRGSSNMQAKRYNAAIEDYEQSVDLGATADGCSCEPYNSLVALYSEQKQDYDRAWSVVKRAALAKKVIAPDLLMKLKKDSAP